MRISDLSRKTGLPVSTIKFYLRDGLLPPGEPTGRNQARYGESHLRRLGLIRALTTVGRLDLTSVRTLLLAVEDEQVPLAELYDAVHRAVAHAHAHALPAKPENIDQVHTEIDRFIARLGWKVGPDAPGREPLALVLATLRDLGCECDIDAFTPYAHAARRIAAQEMDRPPANAGEADRLGVVVRGVLLEVALTSLRLMAERHEAIQRFGVPTRG
jgi:DNA-binding transcriptional MerR regulator